ncbi:hypothetical protein U27_03652 [Candidatus Vecturithrix granuli]|uniref:Uncharacterized protein n=1 Tax=Vecturithrix granuli TaxID=1499967 RepID=A0A081BWI4_VECG1|nr:hypothetical protein U27_03652 [Candidatus Vecturithrix granuli]
MGSRRRELREPVRIQTNDPEQPVTQIFVMANVLADIEVTPPLLRFGDHQSLAQVTVKSYVDAPVELREIRADRHLEATVSAMTIPVHGEVVVSAELIKEKIPEFVKGHVGGLVEITTNLESMPTIRIPIWAKKPVK